MIDIAILCTVFGVFILVAFIKGVEIGVKLRKEETIEVPTLNPATHIKKKLEEKEFKESQNKEQERIEIMLENIENYNGTDIGQKDIPR